MTIRYAAKHGPNRANTERAIANRQPFSAGNLSGGGLSTTGRLPEPYRTQISDAAAALDYYVVYSYATPIAYWIEGLGWTIPDVKYSVTTSNHQSLVRLATREA